MKKFFSDKFNIALVALASASMLFLIISSWVEFFIPLDLFLFGVTCIFVSILLIRKLNRAKRNSAVDFIDEEDEGKRRRQMFFEREGRTNTIITIACFIIFGIVLIYMAIDML